MVAYSLPTLPEPAYSELTTMRSCLFCTETPTNRLPQTGQNIGSPDLGAGQFGRTGLK